MAKKPSVRQSRESDDYGVGELLVRAFDTQNALKMPGVFSTAERNADLRNQAQKRENATVLVG